MPVVADPPESHPRQSSQYLVDVAQLVEHRIVIPVVAGSIPVIHPIFPLKITKFSSLWIFNS